jgi:hypothetical protein
MESVGNKILSIPCDYIGKIGLIGVSGQTATFVASKLQVVSTTVFRKCMSDEFINSIVTEPLHNTEGLTTAVFQCSFCGRLRNPKGFLKHARNRLVHVIERTETEVYS